MRERENFRGKAAGRKEGSSSANADSNAKYEKFLDKVVKLHPELEVLKAGRHRTEPR